MTDTFELKIDGSKYSGWTSLQVTKSLEQLAHSFSVKLTDRWEQEMKPVPIQAGQECVVAINSNNVVTGYIDSDELSYDASTRDLSFSGRSKTADLVDCSAIFSSGTWKKQKILKIAKDLCQPFGITCQASDEGEAFTSYSLTPGNTVFQCLEELARQRSLLLLTDVDGNLVFDRVASMKVTTVLERGKNILKGGRSRSWQDRFKTYILKCQSKGTNTWSGEKASAIKKQSEDAGVNRYRPLIITPDTEDSGTELQKRADWERNVRAGRSTRWTYVVQGWATDGVLWEPNFLVRVKDTDAELDDDLLVVSVTMARSEEGTTTELQLTIPGAFDIQPLPPVNKSKTSAWKAPK